MLALQLSGWHPLVTMKYSSFLTLALVSASLATAIACSDDKESRGTGGSPAAGGKANSGGTGGALTSGAGGTGGTGDTGGKASAGGSGGSVTGGAGGTGGVSNSGGAAGSVMCRSGVVAPDITNCDAAKLAALFKAGNKCAGCHFNANLHSFHTEAGLADAINKPADKTANLNCATTTLVVPGDPEASLLYLKLKGTPPANCGTQMPKPEGNRMQCTLTADELKCVADWINSLPAGGAGGQGGQGGKSSESND